MGGDETARAEKEHCCSLSVGHGMWCNEQKIGQFHSHTVGHVMMWWDCQEEKRVVSPTSCWSWWDVMRLPSKKKGTVTYILLIMSQAAVRMSCRKRQSPHLLFIMLTRIHCRKKMTLTRCTSCWSEYMAGKGSVTHMLFIMGWDVIKLLMQQLYSLTAHDEVRIHWLNISMPLTHCDIWQWTQVMYSLSVTHIWLPQLLSMR